MPDGWDSAAQSGTPSDAQTPTTPTPAPAQEGQAAPAAAPAAPAPPSAYHQMGMDFSFLFDGYVDGNFDNPDSGFNGLRNFDYRSNTVHFNMGKITIDRAPGPVGFHLDVGFGEIFSATHAADAAPEGMKYFEQAYVDFKPKSWKGVEVDVGEFVTSAGAEVIDVNQNWNYSRSLLFAWAIPYYHFGIRTSFPVGPHFTGGVQLVNGWNNVYASDQGKLIGLNGAYAWKKVTWTEVWYGGPERDKDSPGWRNLIDSVLQVNPNDNLSLYVNVDYGRNKNIGPGTAQWDGIAGAVRRASRQEGRYCRTPGDLRRRERLLDRHRADGEGIHGYRRIQALRLADSAGWSSATIGRASRFSRTGNGVMQEEPAHRAAGHDRLFWAQEVATSDT